MTNTATTRDSVKIVNLTPHVVNVVDESGNLIDYIPCSGMIARASMRRETVDYIKVEGVDVPINQTRIGKVYDLPDPKPGTIYIVSLLTAQNCRDRDDLYVVDDTIRDDDGRIVGCRALARI